MCVCVCVCVFWNMHPVYSTHICLSVTTKSAIYLVYIRRKQGMCNGILCGVFKIFVVQLISDELVVFWELSLDMHTPRVEKKLLSLLSIETLLGTHTPTQTKRLP